MTSTAPGALIAYVVLVVVCGVGLLTAGAGLPAERILRWTPPPPEVRGSNGEA